MKSYQKICECFAVMFDPANPKREAAFHVSVVTMLDPEDGGEPLMDSRIPAETLTMAEAKARGLELPAIAAAFESDTLAIKESLEVEAVDLRRIRDEHLPAAEAEIARLRELVEGEPARQQKAVVQALAAAIKEVPADVPGRTE